MVVLVSSLVFLALVATPFRVLRLEDPFITLADLLFVTAFLLLIVGHRIRPPAVGHVPGVLWVCAILLLVTGFTVSGIYHEAAGRGFSLTLQVLVATLVVPLVMGHVAATGSMLQSLLRVYAAIIAITALLTIVMYYTGFGRNIVATPADRFQGFSENANAYARVLAVALPVLGYLVLVERGVLRSLYAAGLGVSAAALLGTAAFGGFLALVAGLMGAMASLGLRRQSLAVLAGAVGLSFGLVYFGALGAFERRMMALLEAGDLSGAGSAVVRIADIEQAVTSWFSSSPLTGLGPGNSLVHVSFIQVALDGGVLAIAGMLVATLALWLGIRRREALAGPDRMIRAFGVAVICASIVGFGTASSLFVREWWVGLTLGVLMATSRSGQTASSSYVPASLVSAHLKPAAQGDRCA